LKELFAQLSPAVPLVEAVNEATGSGFLVKQGSNYFVITNRHVIENARQGVAVHFLPGDERRFSVPKEQTRIVRVHRSADLAIVDVTQAAKEIDKLRIEAVQLAPAGHSPKVGEHVFAIGHPGGGAVGLLTSTLTDGIVSAVGRPADKSTFVQVTTPINPGNSGGPLFDDEGQVVGVNTFILRKNRGDVNLEALNFALEGSFIREVLSDPGKSLSAPEIAALLAPPQKPVMLEAALKAKLVKIVVGGYRPLGGSVERSTKIFGLGADNRHVIRFFCREAGDYAVAAVNTGSDHLDLAVVDGAGTVVASDTQAKPDPDVAFKVKEPGVYTVFVLNGSKMDAIVVLMLMEKRNLGANKKERPAEHFNWGIKHLEKKQYNEAIAEFTEVIRMDPGFPKAYLNRGIAYMGRKEYDTAIADFSQVIRIEPRDAMAYTNRGLAYSKKKDYDSAIVDYQLAIQIDPKEVSAYNALAWVLAACPKANVRNGRQAVEIATIACKLSEWMDPVALDTLSAAKAQSGNFREAVLWEKKAIELFADPEYTQKARERLKLYEKGKPYRDE
jgi:tetratricopeptide (TPR) repeat protein/V8-like Glu-specific endopeptidase